MMNKTVFLHAMPRRVLAAAFLAAASLTGVAQAQNATNGEAIFGRTIVEGTKSCLSCHGTPQEDPVLIRGADASRIKSATMTQARMMALNGKLSDTEFNDLAAYIGKTLGATPTYLVVAGTPSASVSAATLSFASQNINTSSAAQTLTVSNAAGATAALKLGTLGTTAGSDFAVTGGTCAANASIAAGSGCTVNITFRPTAVGTRNGTFTVNHNGTGGKSEVSLSGSAVNTSPAVTVSPTALSFSSVVATASSPMRVTVSNTGTGTLQLSSLTLGGSQASDYALASSSTCTANGMVAGGSSCVADIVFTPAATGGRTGTLTIAHNAAGSPSTVSLSGTGTSVAQPGIALDTTSLDLGRQVVAMTSSAKTITLTNSGAAALTLNSVATSGTDAASFVLGGSCTAGTSVPAKGTCTVTVAMRPTTLGLKTASLDINSNAPTGMATVALRGTSVNTPAPEVGLSQAAVGFGGVTLGTRSTPRTVTLSNIGTAAMSITGIASSSAEFVSTHDCPASLAVAASCTISIVYAPTTAHASESVVITTNAVSSPNSIVVTGLGSALTMPVLAWQPNATALNFAATVVGVSSASQSLTLVNTGPGSVTLNSLGMAGAAASSFAIASSSTCKSGLVLSADASCTVAISFVPGSTGSKTANLQISSNGTPPGDIALSGTGASPSSTSGMITVSQTTLDFSSIGTVSGSSSAPLTLSISNGSAAPVTVSSIRTAAPFAIVAASSNNCVATGVTLQPGSACNLAVVFSPTSAGASTGTVTIVTPNQTVEVALKGQATPGTPKLAWTSNATTWMFSTTVVGMSSAAQTTTLSNQGPGTATLNAVNVSGSDSAAFSVSSASTCKAGAALNAGASCTVVMSFMPATVGSKTATLRVESNATSAGDVTLSGSGMAATPVNGVLSVDKTTLDFSGTMVNLGQTSAPMSVTVANGAVAAVSLSKVEVSGPFKLSSNNCPAPSGSLAVNASCVIGVTFAPTSTGNANGSLTLTTASQQTIVVQLKGLTATSAPVLAWQTAGAQALQFDATTIGSTSASKTLTLVNQGPGAVTFTAIEIEGVHWAAFMLTSGTSCSTASMLAQGSSCVIQLAFAPGGAGIHSGSLRVASNASAPAAVSLSGNGLSNTGGATGLTLDGSSFNFMGANGRTSAAIPVQVSNAGSTNLTISDIGTFGPFQVVNSASGGCSVPQVLAPGASCSISVVFTAPLKAGDSSGTLRVASAGGESKTATLSGRSIVTNVGADNDQNETGGGAIGPWFLLVFGLAGIALWRGRRPVSSL